MSIARGTNCCEPFWRLANFCALCGVGFAQTDNEKNKRFVAHVRASQFQALGSKGEPLSAASIFLRMYPCNPSKGLIINIQNGKVLYFFLLPLGN